MEDLLKLLNCSIEEINSYLEAVPAEEFLENLKELIQYKYSDNKDLSKKDFIKLKLNEISLILNETNEDEL